MFQRKKESKEVAVEVPPQSQSIRIMTNHQVAEMFGRPLSWVDEKTRRSCKNPLPARSDGRYRYFLRHEVEAWALSPERLVANQPSAPRKPRRARTPKVAA